jgi:hypothetical protein
VKSHMAMRPGIPSLVVMLLAASLLTPAVHAGDKKDKPKAAGPQTVDSGSFGVFVKGQRVVTETFNIEQSNGINIIKSQLKETSGAEAATQKSEMRIAANGDLLQYDWSQSSGSSLTVLPNNDFLIEKITPAGAGKPAEKPFLMPTASSILDNNFFVQREVLVWRYLQADCEPNGGDLRCQKGPAQFGVLVPQDQSSASVRLELVGKEKVAIHGAERGLLRLTLKGENFEWSLWVDDQNQFKLMRVSIPADDTEVVRD